MIFLVWQESPASREESELGKGSDNGQVPVSIDRIWKKFIIARLWPRLVPNFCRGLQTTPPSP